MVEGFKETEVGLLPIDWGCEKLPDVVDYIHGKAHEQFVNENGEYVIVNSKFISSEGEVRKYSNKNFQPGRIGDILTVLSDLPNGKALAKCFFVDKNDYYAVNQRVCIWRSKSADSSFLFHVLNRNKYFLNLNDGVSQTHILNKHIEECHIQVPPNKAEQNAIATALNDADALITALEKLIAKKKAIKQGAMQALLRPKEGWVELRLGDLGKFKSSSVDKVFREQDEEVFLLNYMDVYRNTVLTKEKIKGRTTANGTQIKKLDLMKGDVVFTPTSETPDDIGHAALISTDLKDTVFSYHVVRLRFHSTKLIDELKPFILNSTQLGGYFFEKATGSTRYVLKKSDFEDATIHVPSNCDDQKWIAQILSDMDSEIVSLEQKLEKQKQIKQGMTRDLLTGKIRLV
jgi:type I restriction enzyme S subunit